jgi:hypothetical protein
MQVTFPSAAFFQALRQLMQEEEARFRRLGFIDTTFGVHVTSPDGQEWRFVLAFEVFECREVREVQDFSEIPFDYVIRGDFAAWQEMLTNIHEHGQADVAHSLNTLTHFGERLQVTYDDPDDRDKFLRFQERIQEFFDRASKLDMTFNRGSLTADH